MARPYKRKMIYYLNQALQDTSTARNNIFILGIPKINTGIWKFLKLSVDTSKAKGKAKFRGSYVWNLFNFTSLLPTEFDDATEHMYINDSSNWHPIWVDSYGDDAGSSVFQPVPTSYTSVQFNVPHYQEQKFSGSFNTNPFITIDTENPETLNAEKILYAASIIPGYPVMTASSISNHKSYGPVFFQNISYSVSGQESLSPVNIECSFLGGKVLIDPNLSIRKPDIQIFEPITDIYQNNNDESNFNYLPYRKANIIDCMISFSTVKNKEELHSGLIKRIDYTSEPALKLTKMSLNITQNIELIFTTPQDSLLNYYGDKIGPKYVEISNRKVTGSITFYSTEREIYLNNTGSLTMYFGNDFFFPFDDVEWQKPKFKAIEKGYEHEYNFIARVAKNSLNTPDTKYKNFPVSEFAINYADLL